MFYSHEILTSRKYGVATIWLVATLGSKSTLKRINRKQILDVDVAKTCQTIMDPVAPMALRLQGNLLYGVSRVYLQQCGYVLSDAQMARNTMQMMLRTVENAALDPDAGKARPEQLVLPDDPSFLPEFALAPPELLADLDLPFDLGITRTGESQTFTPFGSQHSQSSHGNAIGGLVLPSSSPSMPRGEFRLEDDNEPGSIGGPSGMLGAGDMLEVLEPDFTFGEDGDIIDLTAGNAVARTPGAPGRNTMHSDAGASERVRREHEEGRRTDAQFPGDQMDIDFPIYGDDLPEGEAFSSSANPQGSEQVEVLHSTSTASAPMRRKRRTARALPTDATIELRNKDLADWNANYLENMKAATQHKIKSRAGPIAKKNAEYFVWGSGIGGIADHMLGTKGSNPFAMFIGDNLFELLTGMNRKKAAGKKHDRDSGIDDATQEESRRVRQKTGEPEEQIGRGLDEDDLFMAGGDEVELPREAETALDDQHIFSAMPWNISASIRGSSAIPRSGRVAMLGSADQNKRGSRMVSASPLLGRGQPGGLQDFKALESDIDFAYGGDEFALLGISSDFPEPEAPLLATTRVRDALSAEGENFLTFVTEAIAEKRNRAQADLEPMSDFLQAEAAADIDEITFEELLPPSENTKVIACQGLMMVLALGMKGMLDVQQPEGFGEIGLKLTEKAKAMQVVEISDGEESESEESEADTAHEEEEVQGENIQEEGVQEEGYFQEQFASGSTAHEDGDHDSLYGY
ncbi:R8 protein [Neocucurbitaria cava]|uniref:R8 protein n=1 Tax=Neocucurbitaria cava TaxID=798079 RepID=A0A9W9CLL0_9PLEO|nr:R8 protein [Neocucurbitaria cava]